MLEGFGLYEWVIDAHMRRRESRFISVKLDSNTSHANQSYDQLVDQNDKKLAAETLSSQCKIIRRQNHGWELYQCILIHTGIALVVAMTEDMCQLSFDVINLHPPGRKYFDAFCGTRIKKSSRRVKELDLSVLLHLHQRSMRFSLHCGTLCLVERSILDSISSTGGIINILLSMFKIFTRHERLYFPTWTTFVFAFCWQGIIQIWFKWEFLGRERQN